MKKITAVLTSVLVLLPVVLLAQGEPWRFEVGGKGLIEKKPNAFYYDIDPYLPIDALLTTNRYILDENLIVQVERAVGRSTFMADPYLLRIPVQIPQFYDLENQSLTLELAPYQERGVTGWEVQILETGGVTFRTIQGNGPLPASIAWDGRGDDGSVMTVGDIYSFLIILTMKDDSQMRKIGRPIDVNGLAYENVVAIKESEIESYDMDMGGSPKVARYYQYVLNRFREQNATRILVKSPNSDLGDVALAYLEGRLYNAKLSAVTDPEYSRVEFIFQ